MSTVIPLTEREEVGKWKWELETVVPHFLSVFGVYILLLIYFGGVSGRPMWYGSWLRWCSYADLTVASYSSMREEAFFVLSFLPAEPPSLSFWHRLNHIPQLWLWPHTLRPALLSYL